MDSGFLTMECRSGVPGGLLCSTPDCDRANCNDAGFPPVDFTVSPGCKRGFDDNEWVYPRCFGFANSGGEGFQASPDHFSSPSSSTSISVYLIVAAAVAFLIVAAFKRSKASSFALANQDRLVSVNIVTKIMRESSIIGIFAHPVGDPYSFIPRIIGLTLSLLLQVLSVAVVAALNLDNLAEPGGSIENIGSSFLLSFVVGTILSTVLGVELFRTTVQDGPFLADGPKVPRAVAMAIGVGLAVVGAGGAAFFLVAGPEVVGDSHNIDVGAILGQIGATWVSTYLVSEPAFIALKFIAWGERHMWSVAWLLAAGGIAGAASKRTAKVGPAHESESGEVEMTRASASDERSDVEHGSGAERASDDSQS
ncbi:hypothetical protein, variant [Thecamonas trahens ATCC 50062]|nr:hypothetical protein, variant [Thecamonas trahens ATCC 50062]KNC50823.1 hypothetical protein, variant [Thecamonas trahens ATCC 50062]|eukprot:XP_013756778.1 hypothetical protein, variant [Thecamonas trahens ATCC 50062]